MALGGVNVLNASALLLDRRVEPQGSAPRGGGVAVVDLELAQRQVDLVQVVGRHECLTRGDSGAERSPGAPQSAKAGGAAILERGEEARRLSGPALDLSLESE